MSNRKTRKLKNKLLVPFEWIGIGLGLCVMPWLPRRLLFALCDALSAVMYVFDRRGKRRALENLRIVRGRAKSAAEPWAFDPDTAAYDATSAERKVIRRSYRNMARSVGYAFWTICAARRRCAETGEMDARTRTFLAANKPCVTVSGHLGCWEILSQLAFLEGHRMMSVAKDIGTGGMTALLMRARRSIGQEIVHAEGAFKPLMQGLKDGKSLGLLVDQSVSPKRGGIWIRLFGLPFAASPAPAFFAAKGKVPIIIAWSRPLKDGRYRCEYVDAISAAEARDIRGTTQRCADALATVIRRHPSCWVMNYNFFSNRAAVCRIPSAAGGERMRVLQLLPAMEQGGVETVVCDLNRVVVGNGWESVVVSRGGRLVGRIESDGGRHVAMDVKSKNPLTYPIRVWQLRRIIQIEKPDLVCVHSRVPAWLYVGVRTLNSILATIKQFSTLATIKQSNNQTIKQFSTPWLTYAHGANSVSRYSAVMTKGDLTVVPSCFLADFLKANYGLAEEKIRVIHPAVDTRRFDPDNLDHAFVEQKRREWEIREGDRVTMVVGRITPVKGLEGLLRDFAKRAAEDPRQKLVIVGGADRHHLKYLESLKSLASSLVPRPSSVVFAGQQEKIPECLSLADEVVSANVTKPESFGLSVVEAYAMNKPVRAKRFGGVAEIMAAVGAERASTYREAVVKLYGPERLRAETCALYAELVGLTGQ